MEQIESGKFPKAPSKYYSKEGYFVSSIGGGSFDVKNRETEEWHAYKYSEMGIDSEAITKENEWDVVEAALAKFLGEEKLYRQWKNETPAIKK